MSEDDKRAESEPIAGELVKQVSDVISVLHAMMARLIAIEMYVREQPGFSEDRFETRLTEVRSEMATAVPQRPVSTEAAALVEMLRRFQGPAH